MDFRIDKNQEMLRTMARDFVAKEVAPYAGEWDKKEIVPMDAIEKLKDLGLMSIAVPEEYGGPGIDNVSLCLIMEELAKGDAGLATIVMASALLGSDPVLIAGNDEQKKWWYDRILDGAIAAFCLTEPGAGTDAGNMSTRAVKDGDSYVISGTKQFISNAEFAQQFTLMATLDKKMGSKGMCAFMIDRDTPGISISKKEEKLGIRSSATNEVVFDNVRVPAKNLLGAEGQGMHIIMQTLDISRTGVAAMATGIAQASLEAAIKYAGEREQLIPIAATPRRSAVTAKLSGRHPVNVLPLLSNVIITKTGSFVFSLTARTAALTSYKSLIVSIATRSAPAASPATACSR
jgi:butyryl-CoA dehydrogenase